MTELKQTQERRQGAGKHCWDGCSNSALHSGKTRRGFHFTKGGELCDWDMDSTVLVNGLRGGIKIHSRFIHPGLILFIWP